MRAVRRTLKLSQERFALALGMHRNSISRYERGERSVPSTLCRSVEDLYAREAFEQKRERDVATLNGLREHRRRHQWESGQARLSVGQQAKADRARYYADMGNAGGIWLQRRQDLFIGAAAYFCIWFQLETAALPLLEPSGATDLAAVLAATITLVLAPLEILQTIRFARTQRQFYPNSRTLPRSRHPNSWKWRVAETVATAFKNTSQPILPWKSST